MAGGFLLGGILTLLEHIEKHRAAFEYDWRHRFCLPLSGCPDEMRWDEAARLARLLAGDPSSQVGAALQGWDFPVSREALVAMDQFDLDHTVAAGGKKVKPHAGRPTKDVEVERRGNTAGRSQAEVRALLAAAAAGEL